MKLSALLCTPTCCAATLGLICFATSPAFAQRVTIGNFNPYPELPYEATTLQQDAWYKDARSLQGDGIEMRQLSACDSLIQDGTTPKLLYRWAYLRRITLLSYTSRETQAVETGRQWLLDNPDDPDANQVRRVLCQIVGQRGNAGFKPTFELLDDVFNDLFEHYTTKDWGLVDAHIEYARYLFKFAQLHETDNFAVQELRLVHLLAAEETVLDILSDETRTVTDQEMDRGIDYIMDTIRPQRTPGSRINAEGVERDRQEVRALMREFALRALERELAESIPEASDN